MKKLNKGRLKTKEAKILFNLTFGKNNIETIILSCLSYYYNFQ